MKVKMSQITNQHFARFLAVNKAQFIFQENSAAENAAFL
jgi:hypothetical protein